MDDELTPDQFAELKADLLRLTRDLQASLAGTERHSDTVELDQAAVGRISRVDALQAQQMALAQNERVRARLEQVRLALLRHEEDAYSECLRCGEPIGYRRLKAYPESPFCVPCKTRLEARP